MADIPDLSGWLLPFFKPVCREVLDPYFLEQGFEHTDIDREATIAYSNGDHTVGFSYWIEDRPNFVVMIGLAEGSYHQDAGAALGDLAAIMDDNAKYWEWNFHNPDELRQVLMRIRDQVLPNYAAPLWQQPTVLHQRLIQARERLDTQADSRKVARTKELAAAAFRGERFDQVISLYRQLSPVDLSPADQKRLDIALKRTRR